jgi:hypothetical protein
MRCEVCGGEFSLAHDCPGPSAEQLAQAQEPATPADAGILYYLKQGWAIARWDDAAIRRASRDPNAMVFGMAFFLVAQFLAAANQLVWLALTSEVKIDWMAAALGVFFGAGLGAAVGVGQIGLCHLGVKLVLGGRGKFQALLRPLLLGSIVFVAALVPVVGFLAAAIWWGLAIMLFVFGEVHGVDRVKAFGVIFVVGLIVRAGLFALTGR